MITNLNDLPNFITIKGSSGKIIKEYLGIEENVPVNVGSSKQQIANNK